MAFAAVLLLLCAPIARADPVTFTGPLTQGGLVEGHVAPGSKVSVDGAPVRVSPEGVFLAGFGREAVKAIVEVASPDGSRETKVLAVAPRKFDIQRVDGLPERMVTPPPEVLERIKAEGAMVREVRRRDDARTDFLAGFLWPVTGPISGVYGSQRILNGQPRAPHYGVDIAVPTGTPIMAPADGMVTMIADLYLTGWTVILDHGHGLSSVFMHLSEVAAKDGQRMGRGAPIGKAGATGRATGPHLHWGLNLFETRLDPQLLAPPMPKPE
ncbi:MAG: M23 family metallopeptidase [Alphaproteobacteria bacterium]|nr:M23 family metallopeptidase [Alphaproteobacteria bacterium]